MPVYDDFNEEYDYREKYDRENLSEAQKESKEKQIITPIRRKEMGR